MGGPSAEYAISLRTGKMILQNLDRARYRARSIVVSKKGLWPIPFSRLKKEFDLVFIAMHGEYGEDGTVQALLEKYHIPFTGSGSRASRLGMNKIASGKLFERSKLHVPQPATALPLVVKPADRGSSVGVSIVKKISELTPAITKALQSSSSILLQQYIRGREFTCGVLEWKIVGTRNQARETSCLCRGNLLALPPTEIIPKGATFFDFNAKYTAGASKEVTPPRMRAKTINAIQRIALTAHQAIGARGFSRTDMILDKQGRLWVLEINTIPGMTATSLLPQGAKAAGIEFAKLLDVIIDTALSKIH